MNHSKLKHNDKNAGSFNEEDMENNEAGINSMLQELSGYKQKSLERQNIKIKPHNKDVISAYLKKVENACHSQIESTQKLSFEYHKCIESEINKLEISRKQLKTQEAQLTKAFDSCFKSLGELQADHTGYAENVLKLQTSYQKKFEDFNIKHEEEFKAMQNNVKKGYMDLHRKIKNDVKEKQDRNLREALRNVFKL